MKSSDLYMVRHSPWHISSVQFKIDELLISFRFWCSYIVCTPWSNRGGPWTYIP